MSAVFLELDEILAIHDMQLEQHGGASGIRDIGLLESALYRPQSGYYENEIDMAAALWESLSQNHPFIDGNKRTALLSVLTFLTYNGYEWDFEHKEIFEFLSERYSTHSMHFEILREWLLRGVRKS